MTISYNLSRLFVTNKYSFYGSAPANGTWFPLFPTPGHPEFPAAHATSGGVVSAMLTNVFGENFDFTLNHYEYLGLPARSYTSIDELGMEMANNARKLRFSQTPEL